MPPPLDRTAAHPLLGRDLAAFGDRTALVTADEEISYAALAERVERAARRLGTGRRLVLVAGANSVDAVVGYLGALAAGHAVLLTPDDDAVIGSLTAAYDPDVVCRTRRGRWQCTERRDGSAHELHPELALLLSTSGSTGSPKLVRLSYDNLRANAESIADYLGIRPTDRAATTLPLHYCYGLSVLHSHLVRGAGLVLTGLSVADTCFWELFRRARGTSLAGVPYTFTLLERVGFAAMDLPDLRYLTQAGGRMAPEQVRHFAQLGRRRGFDLFVMYGQTEATARMAYLPPDRALTSPAAIGVPVPGGDLRLAPVDDLPGADVGELVYTGPNVMLGYAETPADLRLGRTVRELRTGDLARRTEDGLFEIVGRRSRFAKVFGLRIDLQRVEAGLEADGVRACCVASENELVVVVEQSGRDEQLPRLIASRCALPPRAVRVLALPELPRLASGKVDVPAVAALAANPGQATRPAGHPGRGDGRPAGHPGPATRPAAGPGPATRPAVAAAASVGPATVAEDDGARLRELFAEILDRRDVTDDSSFVGLGGDSLSYVEMSVRLEQLLGPLPAGWHTMPIRRLRDGARPAVPRRRRTLDTVVALRAAAIVLIVGSHIELFTVRGGAHLLLAVAGFNFARFHLTDIARRRRLRHLGASVARIAVPSSLLLALVALLDHRYGWQNVLLLNEALGPRTGPQRNYWFVETLVYTLLALLALLALPVVDRWERRGPFALPLALLAAGLTVRYGLLPLSPWDNLATPVLLFWFFALGWAAAKATAWWQRSLLAVVGVTAVVGYFGNPLREAVIVTGFLLLTWLPRLPSVAALNRVASVLAGASLYIYLIHWQVYPLLQSYSRLLALAACLAAGVLFGTLVGWATRCLPRPRGRLAASPPATALVT
ncbi:acyl-CoA synthetase (AMP-forming)/AMP-acid ligase II [Krasilnikovia cinnamomea]|uniref:Acyl-CoA synthetase (AMP-forming)/AMP-acid ligase II n=1 Tax=Krasilnikovia cinnamomea TaxID=349313 RepID=A0A4Q7ZTC2_9ACTN|nr:non-ribosomal peptide synthetase [Krasilnikovia cinnamomea]RZU54462.1 acyl-CoA synthetase (AMP-forming)/AMP-acid ligase II [Krasilnikovia cinnamomea]